LRKDNPIAHNTAKKSINNRTGTERQQPKEDIIQGGSGTERCSFAEIPFVCIARKKKE